MSFDSIGLENTENKTVGGNAKNTEHVSDRGKILFAESVSASESSILIGDLAKILKQNGLSVGPRRFFALLHEDGYLCTSGGRKNMPTQRAMELGVLCLQETAILHGNGNVSLRLTTKVTGKGQVYFVEKYLAGRNEES